MAASSGGWAGTPLPWDPHLTTDVDSAIYVVELFSGLVTIDRNLKIVPDIAKSWDISGGGSVYTFFLKDNVRFHDGKQVTARDFKYSLERAADPVLGSPVAETYLGDIKGVFDKLQGNTREISGVKVINDLTLEITIDSPKAYFLAQLTYPTAFVVDQKNVERGGRTWFLRPNGTGPFKLQQYRIGERLVLEKNDFYYRGPVQLDRVDFFLGGGTPMAQYEAGEIDVIGVGLADLSRVLNQDDPLNRELAQIPVGFSTSYLGFNVAKPPFDDPKVRQALTLAVDKEAIAREVLSNLVVPAYSILPPGFPGFNPDLKGLRFDPIEAKRLLSQSKYPDPAQMPRITLTVPGTGGAIGLDLEAILQMWKENLGLTKVEIQQVEFATFSQETQRKKYQLFALGWSADYPDPYDFLDILFYSKSTNNHTNYSNPEADRLLLRARTEQDVGKRIALYQKIERTIVNDAPWLLLWFSGERFALVKPYVKNYVIPPFVIERFKDVHIER